MFEVIDGDRQSANPSDAEQVLVAADLAAQQASQQRVPILVGDAMDHPIAATATAADC